MQHSAIQSFGKTSPEIFPGVYDWFFADDAFERWRKARMTWPLHCIGSPGAGKTTLAVLVYQHLKEDPDTRHYPIADIHIGKDVPDHHTYFIEDFLEILYNKLAATTFIEADHSNDAYDRYSKMRHSFNDAPEGYTSKERLQSLREALYLRLSVLQEARAFLLLDGIDRCSHLQRVLLNVELSVLLEKGLSILITSRLAVMERFEALCEHPDHPVFEYAPLSLNMYYECRVCEYIVCVPCVDAKRSCPNGDKYSELHESYDHVNIDIAVPEMAMRNYIAWNLELEHGNLGLGSSARKPPLSPLGKSLLSKSASKSVQKQADDVYEAAAGHIGMAKARLDFIHIMTTLEGMESRRDQLPTNIVTMYDSALKFVEKQPNGQSDIALKVLAATATDSRGVEVPILREVLSDLHALEVRSGEDMLEACRGFLVTSTCDTKGLRLASFHDSFFRYVVERYNQNIYRASMQINPPRARFANPEIGSPATVTHHKLVRSITQPIQPFITRKDTRDWT